MRNLVLASSLATSTALTVLACGDDDEAPAATPTPDAGQGVDAGPGEDLDAGSDANDAGAYVEAACFLRDDTGGPGQYSDSCVQRSWIAAYAGTYRSAACTLTISVTGSVAATFTANVASGAIAGDYAIAWDGEPSPGNDSYYRFTTDATFTTTRTLNFTAGQKVGASDERALSLRIEGLDVNAPVYKGRAFQVVSGVSAEQDCGTMTKD